MAKGRRQGAAPRPVARKVDDRELMLDSLKGAVRQLAAPRPVARKVDDRELALTLLKGAYMLRRGLPTLEYVDDDEVLRRALARVLMNSGPLDRELRLLLALLFLPDATPEREAAYSELIGYQLRTPERKLVFTFRGGPRNPRDNTVRDRFIVNLVFCTLHDQVGLPPSDEPARPEARLSVDAAIRRAAERACLSVPTVRGIWYRAGGPELAAALEKEHTSRRKP
jgi:hypothetical protein